MRTSCAIACDGAAKMDKNNNETMASRFPVMANLLFLAPWILQLPRCAGGRNPFVVAHDVESPLGKERLIPTDWDVSPLIVWNALCSLYTTWLIWAPRFPTLKTSQYHLPSIYET